MAAYNQIIGEYCTQNKKFLTDILKDKWGFEGLVVSDWFAVCERDLGAAAGLDLEMPTSAGIGIKASVDAVQSGRLSAEKLDDAVRRVLSVVFKTADGKKVGGFGYGLSFTEFEYSDLCMDKLEMSDVETLTVTVKVKNVGDRTGKGIIQLYVRDAEHPLCHLQIDKKGEYQCIFY